MRKLATFLMSCTLFVTSVHAAEGEMGSFGGITSGIKFETITALSQEKKKTTSKYTLPYKENIYLKCKILCYNKVRLKGG